MINYGFRYKVLLNTMLGMSGLFSLSRIVLQFSLFFFLSSVSDVPLHSFKKLMCSLSGIGDLLSELSLSHTNGEIVVCHIIDFSSYTRCFVVIQETRQ